MTRPWPLMRRSTDDIVTGRPTGRPVSEPKAATRTGWPQDAGSRCALQASGAALVDGEVGVTADLRTADTDLPGLGHQTPSWPHSPDEPIGGPAETVAVGQGAYLLAGQHGRQHRKHDPGRATFETMQPFVWSGRTFRRRHLTVSSGYCCRDGRGRPEAGSPALIIDRAGRPSGSGTFRAPRLSWCSGYLRTRDRSLKRVVSSDRYSPSHSGVRQAM